MGSRALGGVGAAVLCAMAWALPAQAVTITEYPVEGAGAHLPRFIVADPPSTLWYTDDSTATKAVRRMTVFGEPLPSVPTTQPAVDLARASDGTIYWTENSNDTDVAGTGRFGRRTPSGTVSSFVNPSGFPAFAVALDGAGAPWWTGYQAGGGIDGPLLCRPTDANFNAGLCSEMVGPPAGTNGRPFDLTLGPGGLFWTAVFEKDLLIRTDPANPIGGTQFQLPVGSGPFRITVGPDGNLWSTNRSASRIDRITPAGVRQPFSLPPGKGPLDIVSGPDGALWFTEYSGNAIGRMTTNGEYRDFPLPTAGSNPWGITVGPDGALWFTESNPTAAKVGRLELDKPGSGTPPGGGVVADTVPPRFTSPLRMERVRFRAAAARKRKSTPVGSGFRFSLSEPAAVKIVLTRARPGRRSGRRCVPPSARNRRARPCKRYVAAGSLSMAAAQGPNRLAFSGRVRRRKLAPGSYRATATARDRAGNVSKTRVARFTIVSR